MKLTITLVFLMVAATISCFGQQKQQRNQDIFDNLQSNFLNEPMNFEKENLKLKLDSVMVLERIKREYSYDFTTKTIQEIFYEWIPEEDFWYVYSRTDFIYDDNGNLIQEKEYEWYDLDNEWEIDYEYEYSYDENGNMTQEIETSRYADFKRELTYDENGKLIQELSYQDFVKDNNWKISGKAEHIYDANGNMTQQMEYLWNSTENTWTVLRKTEYINDANGFVTHEISYSWNSTENTWIPRYKIEYTNDSFGNILIRIQYDWNSDDNDWILDGKSEVSYDYSYTIEELLQPKMYEMFNHKLNSVINYFLVEGTEEWIESYTMAFHYSDIGTSIQEKEFEKVNVFPNPFTDHINFELGDTQSSTFVLFDLQGTKLMQIQANNNDIINLNHLNNGVYLYNIFIDGVKHSGKLIK